MLCCELLGCCRPHSDTVVVKTALVLSFVFWGPSLSMQSWVNAQDEIQPVASWQFDSEETSKFQVVGNVQRDQPGPRPPEFPDFDSNNLAIKLDGMGARVVIPDPGVDSDFDFTNGDEITIECWVNIAEPIPGNDRNVYLVGKGRTGDARFQPDNQNWALRIRSTDDLCRISFLFATANQGKGGSHWHRWTSKQGFYPGSGWHRLAVAYRFGQPDSMTGWLDQQRLEGQWDMGGATNQPPVNDQDSIWIGSALKGAAGNSLAGSIDQVSIFRGRLTDQQMLKRYRRAGPHRPEQPEEKVPELSPSPGTVLVRLFEGVPAHDKWSRRSALEENLVQQFAWPQMFFHRLPLRYDDWGIRSSWRSTTLLQAATDVQLPAGKHQLLLRARGVSRLWFDDRIIARLGVRKGGSDGHNPVEPLPDPPAADHRRVRFGDQELLLDLDIDQGGLHRIVLESLVGSPKSRAEPGETLLAIRLGGAEDFRLIQPAGSDQPSIPLLDLSIEQLRSSHEDQWRHLDDTQRRTAAKNQDDYWAMRHRHARSWVQHHPDPALALGDPVSALDVSATGVAKVQSKATGIDDFIEAKLAAARAELSKVGDPRLEQFQTKIQPLLNEHCLRCHGEKSEGGLSMLSRQAMLAGGDSGSAAVVPGRPEQSELVARIRSSDEDLRMPPSGNLTKEQQQVLEAWIASGAAWGRVVNESELQYAPIIDDFAFLRRAFLDTVGVPPTEAETRRFIEDTRPNKRALLIDQLLEDPRLADHWVSYWQDVLAENPNILKPSLNNTGPFRYFIYESIRDRKPLDRMVSELIMLRGSEREGGSAGFGMAADNDSPLASRSIVIASAFLGINMQCARCHDSPYHSTTQSDLFSMASMLARKALQVPSTSSVAAGFFEKNKDRQSLIQVTLKPGIPVQPAWNFQEATGACDGTEVESLMVDTADTRERLAVLVTMPSNQRFAAVMVNRVWQRLMGAGIIEPIDDWEKQQASHEQLLVALSRQFVDSGYDFRQLLRTLMNSNLYQRAAVGQNAAASPQDRYFTAPDRRQMSAEQVVDSLFAASGHIMQTEELTFDSDGRRPAQTMISLGYPKRSWQFAEISNERDRPSLALPRAQAILDVLSAFGWTGSRQFAINRRETAPNVLQPGVISNGVMAGWIASVSEGSQLAQLAHDSQSPEQLVDSLLLRFLTRLPTESEREQAVKLLSMGFQSRQVPASMQQKLARPQPLSTVSWTNHLRAEANEIMIEQQRRARLGDPPDPALQPQWREAYEDVVWSLMNSPEFLWIP